jgi:hypothetical protein
MNGKSKIKVIKKGKLQTNRKPVVTARSSKKESAREMVSTVTTWVSELKHRKRDETRQAIEKFFNQQPQTTGA